MFLFLLTLFISFTIIISYTNFSGKKKNFLKNFFHSAKKLINIRAFLYSKIHTPTANAVPTAEGAIEIAISETPITIHASKCLVLGYGKIGKILSKDLYGMGAQTYAAARKYADLAMIEGHGYEPLPFSLLKEHIHEFDIIFNTVPAMVMDEAILSRVKKDTLIIDLASRPGGIDFDAAKKFGLRVIWALSLPGRIAPITSGAIIKDTVMNIINELGV